MRQLLLITVLNVAFFPKAQGTAVCQKVFEPMENANTTNYKVECIAALSLPLEVANPSETTDSDSSSLASKMKFIRDYLALDKASQRSLAKCVFEKQGFLKNGGKDFDSSAVKTQVLESLATIQRSPQKDAVLNAIISDACPLEDGEPNLMKVFKYTVCLRGSCASASSPDAEFLP